MVSRTFLSKCTTIFQKSEDNFGLNPVLMLTYGKDSSHGLIQFSTEKIKQLSDNGAFPKKSSLKHILKMYNCGSIDMLNFGRLLTPVEADGEILRAVSFTIIAFKVPADWDAGIGFDKSTDMWLEGRAAVSLQGCNWFNRDTAHKWENEGIYPYFREDGYQGKTISEEYQKFLNGEDSIVVASQHFEYGNEDLELDVTDYVESIIGSQTRDHGLCVCFSPDDISGPQDARKTYYTGFFTNNTNTFYEPVLETRYDEAVFDARNDFHLGVNNKLYLYVNTPDGQANLDNIPVCEIDGKTYPVEREGIGIYSASVNLNRKEYEADTILTDTWSNLYLDGEEMDDVEMEFVAKAYEGAFSAGKHRTAEPTPLVVLSGIKDDEKLIQGDIREVYINLKMPYSGKEPCKLRKIKYRLYVHDAYRVTDVISWDGVNVASNGSYFTIDTSGLLPATYHVDIMIGYRVFSDRLTFKVVNNSTNQKR